MTKKTSGFSFQLPVHLEKNSKGEWRVRGLASTESVDRQGEKILQDGLDITPLKEGKGLLNYDHSNDPEDLVGKIDKANFTEKGLMIEGYLFNNHKKAQSVYEIMSSLKPEDAKNTMALSVEGKILERAGKDKKIIKRAVIDRVALTTKPVNEDTFLELAKSLSVEPMMKSQFKNAILNKAISIGYSQGDAPQSRTGGGTQVREHITTDFGKEKAIRGMIAVGPELSDILTFLGDVDEKDKKPMRMHPKK